MSIISGWAVKFNYQITNEWTSIQLNSYIVSMICHISATILRIGKKYLQMGN